MKNCIRLDNLRRILQNRREKPWEIGTVSRIGATLNYIILDLEWNQSNRTPQAADQLIFEIIEIGAIKLSEDRNMIGEFSELVKPQVYHEMHRYTSKLIHLQMEELEKGRPFPEVMREFLDWCGEDIMFCSWGPSDLTELQKNMKYYQMPPLADRPIAFYDVQKLFSIAHEDGKARRSLEHAIDFLNLEKDIPFHRAFSDAYYTAKVFAKLADEKVLRNVSYDVYHAPLSKEDEIHIIFDTYAKHIFREFDSKTRLIADREISGIKCYLCGKNLRKKQIPWFSPNRKNYSCVGYCEKHGYIKAKLRVRKDCNEKLYAVKTIKCITKEDFEALKERYAKEKKTKKRRYHSS